MTVDPGFEGQSFITETIEKIKAIKAMSLEQNPELLIQVDGNINVDTIPLTVSAGANVLVLELLLCLIILITVISKN